MTVFRRNARPAADNGELGERPVDALRTRAGRFPALEREAPATRGFHAPQRDRPAKVQHPKPPRGPAS